MGISLESLPPAIRAQIIGKTKGKQKYNACPDSRGAVRFDSRSEARRYDQLILEERAGLIDDLHLQQQFTLQESYVTPSGERVRAIRYIADFTYFRDGKYIVEDVKSRATATDKYKIKRKLMQSRYGIEIQEVEA